MYGEFHLGVARPRVADKADGPLTWKVAVEAQTKQLPTASDRWHSNLGVGRGNITGLETETVDSVVHTLSATAP